MHMARQVVSYDDLDAPPAAYLSTQSENPTTIAALTGATPGFADGNAGRGTTVTVGTTHTAYLTSAGVGATTAPAQDINSRLAVDVSPPKKRKREEASSSIDGGNISIADGHVSEAEPHLPTQAGKKVKGGKKRKNKGKQGNGQQERAIKGTRTGFVVARKSSLPVQHWDDPGAEVDGLAYDDGEAMAFESVEAVAQGMVERYYDEQGNVDGDWEGQMEDEEDMELEDDEDEDESRELTHEEIWDDSALITAWDAANEEYEALHGKKKHWKKDRVHKSPLWYNIPPEPQSKSKKRQKAKAVPHGDQYFVGQGSSVQQPPTSSAMTDASCGDSTPLDFNTYVPTHDASLFSSRIRPAHPGHPPILPEATKTQLSNIVSSYAELGALSDLQSCSTGGRNAQSAAHAHIIDVDQMSPDDAFSRALDAMYWCGYWSAVYHVGYSPLPAANSKLTNFAEHITRHMQTQRSKERGEVGAKERPEGDVDDQDVEEEETELLLSTQR